MTFPVLYSCSSVKTETKRGDINDVIFLPRQQAEREMAEKGGGSFVRDLFIGKTDNNSSGVGVQLSVNPHLWQASLDILSSTMPLASVDSNSGIIISDWYNLKGNQDERVKISVLIKTRELRADGVKVSVFKQKLKASTWSNIKINPLIVQKLERKIVEKAGSIANIRD
tara:strand:- start:3 stop:509 length:507 start_codon:yes stop_codon:yes gene_type:complete